MSFTAIVVLHDSAAHVGVLLASLELLPERPQVVCVDAASGDDGPQIAERWGADVVRLPDNPGFGAANNAGLALARHEATVLLNPDCVLLDAGLARLAALAERRDALLAPRLLNADGSLQRSAHPLPGGRGTLLAALAPPRLLPHPLRERLEPHRARRPVRVGWAIAACVAARTGLLRRLGPFDPSRFLFYEDLDLCLRARAAGIATELRPEIALLHVGGHSTRVALGGDALDLRAHRRREVVAANLGPRALASDDRSQAITFALRALVGRERPRNRAMLAALRAARREAQNSPS